VKFVKKKKRKHVNGCKPNHDINVIRQDVTQHVTKITSDIIPLINHMNPSF